MLNTQFSYQTASCLQEQGGFNLQTLPRSKGKYLFHIHLAHWVEKGEKNYISMFKIVWKFLPCFFIFLPCFQVKWLLCSLGSPGSSHIILKLICSRPEDLVFSPHSAVGETCENWEEGKRKTAEVTPDLAVCVLLVLYFNH